MRRISFLGAVILAFVHFSVDAQEKLQMPGDPATARQLARIIEAARAEAIEQAQIAAGQKQVGQLRLNLPLGVTRVAATQQVETPTPVNVNLFGEGLARELKGAKDAAAANGYSEEPVQPPEYQHLLVFHDGRQLSGQIVSLSADAIVWRRPDANEPMRFSRDAVRRLILTPSAKAVPSPRALPQMEFLQVEGANRDSPSKPAPATIKLPGTDWLFGEVTSKDGKAFEIKAGENSTFTIARSAVEWLYFAPSPAPTAALSPNPLIVESWVPNTPQASVTIDGGTAEIRGVPQISRPILNAKRIEVAFSIPADTEESLRLWLQPHSATPNSYSGGTMAVQFGPKSISRTTVINGLNTERVSLPADLPKGGVIDYRIFYDPEDSRLFVFRNGQKLGPWSTDGGEARARMFGGGTRVQAINYVLFDRPNSPQDAAFKFNRVRVLPWNGFEPEEGASRSEDLLHFNIGASLRGKLQSITPTEIRIADRVCPREADTFLELQRTTERLDDADAEALLSFGINGEVCASGLEIRDGRMHCRTGFAPRFEMPVSALQTIAFSRRAVDPQKISDRLIFKNGDELVGTLLAAGTGQRLRWRMSSGQEIEFESRRVAGVRRPLKAPVVDAPETSAFEFRNGDCLSGQFIALDEQHVRLTHPRLGELTIDRDQLWNLYPRRDLSPVGAAAHPEAWLEVNPASSTKPAADGRKPALDNWIYLDGKFVARADTTNSGVILPKAIEAPSLPEALKRYELRFDCTCARAGLPAATVHLSTQDGNTWIRANLYGGQVRFYQQSRSDRGMNVRQVPLGENTELRSTRASFRIFVDMERGTAALSVNGSKLAMSGERAKDRVPGLGEKVWIYLGGNGLPHVLSNVRIAPWNGEEPAASAGTPTTVFANGDISTVEPTKFNEGRFHLESEAGLLEVPVERVVAVRFRGEPSPARAAGRVRLHDGTVINVQSFRWEGSELTARGLNIGEFKLAAEDVRELVFDPDEPAASDTKPATKQ